MSKRSANCEHSSLDILPGGVIKCRFCGELIEDDGIRGLELDMVRIDEVDENVIRPLTFRLRDAHFKNGGHNG